MNESNAKFTRATPGYVVFLLDQSGSMDDPIGGSNGQKTKKDELAIAINKVLNEMILKSTKADGVLDYFFCSAIGYTTDETGELIIGSVFSEPLSNKDRVGLAELSENILEMKATTEQIYDDETGQLVEMNGQMPIWIKPTAEWGTPMCNAFHHAYQLVDAWIPEHMDCKPPIVIHITDGESNDGDPIPYAEPLRELSTNYGNVLLFNCHLSETESDSFLFPASNEVMPDQNARTLFEMSSELPDDMIRAALDEGFEIEAGGRGFCYNADAVSLIRFLSVGTPLPQAKTLR